LRTDLVAYFKSNNHEGTSHPDTFNTFPNERNIGLSSSVKKVIAYPTLPALPVLPTLCTYVIIELGKS